MVKLRLKRYGRKQRVTWRIAWDSCKKSLSWFIKIILKIKYSKKLENFLKLLRSIESLSKRFNNIKFNLYGYKSII